MAPAAAEGRRRRGGPTGVRSCSALRTAALVLLLAAAAAAWLPAAQGGAEAAGTPSPAAQGGAEAAGAPSPAPALAPAPSSLLPLIAAVVGRPPPGATAAAGSAPAPAASGAAWGSHIFAPLSDSDIEAINALLSGSSGDGGDGGDGSYQFDTGLPLPQLLAGLNASTVEQLAQLLSADRLQTLAALPEPLAWVMRTFQVSGEALAKLRMTTDLQLIIRDAISGSLAEVAGIPPSQILTFASSNTSVCLAFTGVAWQQGAANEDADSHAGLAAVRAALAQLAGGFDPGHIAVSFAPPPPPAGWAAPQPPPPAAGARRLLQSPAGAAAQQQAPGGKPTLVYADFYDVAPANATSLLAALGRRCSPAPAAAAAAARSALEPLAVGADVSPACRDVFQAELSKAGVPLTPAFSVRPAEKPRATVTLSVAVGLTPAQARDNVDERTARWLNSSSLHNILSDFNLTTTTSSSDYIDARTTSGLAGGLGPALANLSSLLPGLFPQQQPAAARGVSRGVVAGVVVAAVASVLALAGVIALAVTRRRAERRAAAAAASGAPDDSLPTISAVASSGGRRRRRRPRLYHSKFISSDASNLSHQASAAPSSLEPGDGSGSSGAPPPQQPHALERGDSVMSAVQFEAAAGVVADGSDESGSRGSGSGASSAGDDGASSSAAAEAAGRQRQQRDGAGGVELQLIRAAAGSADCAAGSAHAVSIALSEETAASSGSSSRDASGSLPRLASDQVPVAALAGHRLRRASSPPLPQQQQQQQQQHGAGRDAMAAARPGQGHVGGEGSGAAGLPPDAVHAAAEVDPAAAFAAMDAGLAARGGGSGATAGAGGVQPLGLSCWHKGAAVAPGVVPGGDGACAGSSPGGSMAGLPHEQQAQQQFLQRSRAAQASPFSPFSPFASEQTQQQQQQQLVQQRHSAAGGPPLPATAEVPHQQQQQQRLSTSGLVSPFASAYSAASDASGVECGGSSDYSSAVAAGAARGSAQPSSGGA